MTAPPATTHTHNLKHHVVVPSQFDQEELKEESLTRLKKEHSIKHQVKDGDFSNYPEISLKTVQKL